MSREVCTFAASISLADKKLNRGMRWGVIVRENDDGGLSVGALLGRSPLTESRPVGRMTQDEFKAVLEGMSLGDAAEVFAMATETLEALEAAALWCEYLKRAGEERLAQERGVGT